jgi:hypothetical protein
MLSPDVKDGFVFVIHFLAALNLCLFDLTFCDEKSVCQVLKYYGYIYRDGLVGNSG